MTSDEDQNLVSTQLKETSVKKIYSKVDTTVISYIRNTTQPKVVSIVVSELTDEVFELTDL